MQDNHCATCFQRLTYELELNRGTAKLVSEIAKYVRFKGVNNVHPRKELENASLTSNEVGNLSRPRFHGLIAKVRGEPGHYLITKKGHQFLDGWPILRTAIIQKATVYEPAHNAGYVPDDYVTIGELVRGWTPYWSLNQYDIVNGEVMRRSVNSQS